MKKVIRLMLIVLAFLVGALLPIRGAVTVQTITASEFNTLTSTNTAAWSVVYRGGGGVTEEIRLARNTANPQIGGGAGTLVGHLTWSDANDLEVLISPAGNISARANSLTVGTLPVVRPFNQILILLYDESVLHSTSLDGININGSSIRNMFAEGFGFPGQSDVVSITQFGSQAPFSLNSVWSPGMFPGDDDQYIRIIGIQNTSVIPEPSISLLIGFASLCMLRRKR